MIKDVARCAGLLKEKLSAEDVCHLRLSALSTVIHTSVFLDN